MVRCCVFPVDVNPQAGGIGIHDETNTHAYLFPSGSKGPPEFQSAADGTSMDDPPAVECGSELVPANRRRVQVTGVRVTLPVEKTLDHSPALEVAVRDAAVVGNADADAAVRDLTSIDPRRIWNLRPSASARLFKAADTIRGNLIHPCRHI